MMRKKERNFHKGDKKQRVLIVHNYYQIPGGEDTVVENEKRMLEEHGHIVALYSRNNAELKNMGKFRKLFLPLTTVFNPRTYKDIKRIIKQQEIDIVHVHNTLNLISPSVYYAALNCGIPVVQTIHNFRLLCPGATFYREGHICEECVTNGLMCAVKHSCYRGSRLQTLACVISTKIHRMLGTYRKINYICLTEFNKEKLLQLNRQGKRRVINPGKLYIKPNFTFDHVSDTQGHEYYLFIGRIEKIKGLDVLLDAFVGLPDEKLIVAGTGTQLEEYKMRNIKNVFFTGFLNRGELSRYLSNAKAVIVPSQWYETFGMIIVEAYAAHKPVIVGNIGNIMSLVDEGMTGLSFDYNSSDALKDAVKRFECENMSKMEENAYRKYKTEFTAEKNYCVLKTIYDSVMAESSMKKFLLNPIDTEVVKEQYKQKYSEKAN